MAIQAELERVSPLVDEGFASIKEAMAFLSLCRATLYKFMDDGELAYAKFGRARRIPWQALKDFAQRNLVGPGA
jgi:excisionase family DNA binding protein